MKKINYSKILFILLASTLAGCGADRVLFMTKTNVGLDIDTKPATAEITIARRELAIQPTYPISHGIKTESPPKETPQKNMYTDEELGLPLLAAFGMQGNFLNPHITGHFAGGDAAYLLAKEDVNESASQIINPDTTLCLQDKPSDSRNWLSKLITNEEEYKKEARQFYFATDTSYGLKVAWSGTAGPYPDSLKLGYNRKEFASPPIFIDEGCTKGRIGWTVKLPSFYASIDNESGFKIFDGDFKENLKEIFNVWSGSTNHVQFFATGSAATEFAKRESVRQIAFANMAPNAANLETLEINKDSFLEIEKAFQTEGNKEILLEKAIELGLVTKSTTTDKFLETLSRYIRNNSYLTTAKLYKLKKAIPSI